MISLFLVLLHSKNAPKKYFMVLNLLFVLKISILFNLINVKYFLKIFNLWMRIMWRKIMFNKRIIVKWLVILINFTYRILRILADLVLIVKWYNQQIEFKNSLFLIKVFQMELINGNLLALKMFRTFKWGLLKENEMDQHLN